MLSARPAIADVVHVPSENPGAYIYYWKAYLTKHNVPAYVGECGGLPRPFATKLVTIQPQGETKGYVFAFDFIPNPPRSRKTSQLINNSQIYNGGVFITKPRVILTELMWGGPGTANLFLHIVRYLYSNNPALIDPQDFESVLTSRPTLACPEE
jgi:hypothetical protein